MSPGSGPPAGPFRNSGIRPVIADIATVIAPLFVIAGIGFAWARSGRPFDTDMIAALATNFGVPCLLFSSLTTLEISPGIFGDISLAYVVVVALNLAVGSLILRAMRLEVGAFLPSLTFPNSGNMGLPLCLFAFGEPGLALAMSPFLIASISNVTIGVALVTGRASLWQLFKNPYVYVVTAALVLMVTDTAPPRWIANTTEIIGGIAIPLMLMALGVTLARLEVRHIRRSAMLAVVRLALGFCFGFAVAELFGFTGVTRGVLILQSAMPVAVMNFLFASRYNRLPEEVAGMIVISTAISFATLPLLLAVVL